MKTLDIIECAEFLKIERTHALKLAGEGTLPGAKIGKAWVFLEEDLVEYLRMQVRMQQRQRAAEAETKTGIELPIAGAIKPAPAPTRPPVVRPKVKRQMPNLDSYALP